MMMTSQNCRGEAVIFITLAIKVALCNAVFPNVPIIHKCLKPQYFTDIIMGNSIFEWMPTQIVCNSNSESTKITPIFICRKRENIYNYATDIARTRFVERPSETETDKSDSKWIEGESERTNRRADTRHSHCPLNFLRASLPKEYFCAIRKIIFNWA